MAIDKVPSHESMVVLLGDLADNEIDVMCLRVMTKDKTIYHWHHSEGKWFKVLGSQG